MRLEGEETLKYRCVCVEKFNIVSNDHQGTHKYDFSVFNLKYPFWGNMFKKKKKKKNQNCQCTLKFGY